MIELRYSRNLTNEFLNYLKNEQKYNQFIKLVNNPKYIKELCLCYRGNSINGKKTKKNESIQIYYANRVVFKLYRNGRFEINMNVCKHAGKMFDDLEKKLKNLGINSYKFNIKDKDISITSIYESMRPLLKNYLKAENNKNEIEKIRQQELLLGLNNTQNGYFVYDSEYNQTFTDDGEKKMYKKHVNDEYKKYYNLNYKDEDNKVNNPDLLAFRFNKSKIESIVLIEVKSTKDAIEGDSGVKKHLFFMDDYIKYENHGFINTRIEEGKMILHHNCYLGVQNKKIDDKQVEKILKQKPKYAEILFIFTDNCISDNDASGLLKGFEKISFSNKQNSICYRKCYKI